MSEGAAPVLVVCTGNTCRSPMMERLLAHRLAEQGVDARVTSAGTHALRGAPMTEDAGLALDGLGVDWQPHHAEQLTDAAIEGAGLVLTATRDHRALVVSQVPSAVGRVFTMREFARVAGAVEAGAGGTGGPGADAAPNATGFAPFIAAVARARGLHPPADPADDDLADPIGRPLDAYEAAARLIDDAARTIAGRLAAGRPASARHPVERADAG
ncbi:low molecular weight phosphatase family protein [Agromyces archimandritae]|uniref:Low molecular weight phosphatase family protein n=1 Tax=Agromyces archimandritae TaxID=2781962 RepID=A0A975IQV3_9MICO|nr:low molecular weight phosphatase family protein [Agromyces archimandritae]QTX05436.1 low molecular weight phosphatase family protein [Agromyces archimandritae]